MNLYWANMRAKIGGRAPRPLILFFAAAFLCLSLFGSTRVSASGNSGEEQGQTLARSCEPQGGGEHRSSHKPDLCCVICGGQADYRWPLAGGSSPLSEVLKPLREVRFLRLSAATIAPSHAPLGSGGAWSSRAPPFVS